MARTSWRWKRDVQLGHVRITKYTTVHESGRIINPLPAKDQIRGATLQESDRPLHEDLLYDPRNGQPLTAGYYGARHLTHLDAPEIEVTFIETDDGYGPYGAKTVGESGIVLAPAAVGNAIFNAIGHRMKDLPITREKILGRSHEDSCQRKRSQSGGGGGAGAGGAPGGPGGLVRRWRYRSTAAGERQDGKRPGSGVPDVLVNLKTVSGLDEVTSGGDGVSIGGLTTLDALSRHPLIRAQFTVLAEAGGERREPPDPQRRHPGRQRLPAALVLVLSQPASRATRREVTSAFPSSARISSMRFSAAAASFIVHPSDTAPALVALDARFEIVGPDGERTLSASEFFVLPSQDPEHENVLGDDEVLASVELPTPRDGVRSTYHKIMDREAWTHALVSAAVVLEMNGDVCQEAQIVLGGVAPIPWRVPEAERLLAGQRVTPELASRVGEAAVEEASPCRRTPTRCRSPEGWSSVPSSRSPRPPEHGRRSPEGHGDLDRVAP